MGQQVERLKAHNYAGQLCLAVVTGRCSARTASLTLDVRLTLQTHDDALVHMTYGGRWTTQAELRQQMADVTTRHQIDPALYHFRTNPLFKIGAKQYTWLKDAVCVGQGYLVEGGIAYQVARVM